MARHTHTYRRRAAHTRASRNIIAEAQSTRPLGAEHRTHCSAAQAHELGPLEGITVNYIAHILRSSESTLSGIIYEEAVLLSIVGVVWIPCNAGADCTRTIYL